MDTSPLVHFFMMAYFQREHPFFFKQILGFQQNQIALSILHQKLQFLCTSNVYKCQEKVF